MNFDRFARLREVQSRAYELAPAIREIFNAAGMRPSDIRSADDLARIPVFKKESMVDRQRENPPFGGFLAAAPEQVDRIFVSPGPIAEPQLKNEADGFGFTEAFAASGIGPRDIALNTWSYHLVPAGLLLDEGLRGTGATVVPAGTGAREIQAKLILDLNVTCICASTAFFMALVETLEGMGHSLPQGWRLRSALLGGELGDWMGKRRAIESRYRIRTFSVYATGDFGVVGFEDGEEGYVIGSQRIVQICDPVSGEPLALGEPGEIVVSTLNQGWPLIRFGTGDVAIARSLREDGTVGRISMLQGRVGQAVKVREIFVYPRQIEELAIALPGVARVQAIVTRPLHREEISLLVALQPGAREEIHLEAIAKRFQDLSRLKADHIEFVAPDAIAEDASLLVDRKADS